MQDKTRRCDICNVQVSSDLSFCPLCGKYLMDSGEKVNNEDAVFPNYDYTYVKRGQWVKMVRNIFIATALIVMIVNLLFTSLIYFPYAWTSLLFIYLAFIQPFKSKGNYLRYAVRLAVCASALLIFIDMYNHLVFEYQFGWSLAYAAPCVLTADAVLIGILALSTHKFELLHFYGALFMVVLACIYLLVESVFFKDVAKWPVLMLICASFVAVLCIFTFKKKKIAKDIKKKFHI